MLEPLGLDQTQEQLYRLLLRTPDASARTLADAAGLPETATRTGLAQLFGLRLAERRRGRPTTYLPTPPDIAITARLNERQSDLDRARQVVPELLAAYQRGASAARPESLVEVCTGPGVGLRRFQELQAAASEELLLFDRVRDPDATGPTEVAAEAPMLDRGVRCRSIYELGSLNLPGRLPHIRHLATLGEQSRVIRQLPMQLAVCDRRVAMLPLAAAPGQRIESVILIEPSTLLDALVDLFEAYWRRSTPLWGSQLTRRTGRRRAGHRPDQRQGTGPADGVPDFSEADRELLHLLNAGLKDEAIARQLGVSMRTIRRKIAGLLDALAVTTRFQAGTAAARRGLL